VDTDRDAATSDAARLLVDALSASGHEASLSQRSSQGPVPPPVRAQWSAKVSAVWDAHGPPDVVHAIGEAAVRVALSATDGTAIPVVATFVGDPSISPTEQGLTERVDRLLVLSAHEAQRWASTGFPRHRIDVFHLPSSTAPEPVAQSAAPAYLVTDAHADSLDAVVASMPAWGTRQGRLRLVALSAITTEDLAALARQTSRRESLDDVELRPGLRGRARSDVIGGASMAIATEPRRDGGLALEAARLGVPSIAIDDDPLSDLVVNGATGLVIPHPINPGILAKAVRHLLNNQVVLDGCGAAALRRVRAVRNAETAARQAVAAYAASMPPAHLADEQSPLPRNGDHGEVEQLVTSHLSLARQLAQRYAGRGQALDDLVGVANLGLVKAAERFDPDHGSPFRSYAAPTIVGELRRYFRDHAWAVRVPRSLQENALDVDRAVDDLRADLGADPTPQQVADQLDISDGDVVRAQQTRHEALSSVSLDRPIGESDSVLGDLLGTDDDRYSGVEEAHAVRDALARLPHRERDIVVMSFYGEQTQSEIADHLGISQVHVSRTLAKTLATLRRHVLDETPLPDDWGAGVTRQGRPRAHP
jgi:RNA polymerase sigma-B factor